jgi:hypothetical protein
MEMSLVSCLGGMQQDLKPKLSPEEARQQAEDLVRKAREKREVL